RPEEGKPGPRLLGGSPREHVVSGEHGRPADSRTAEPEPIEAREREPLDVHDLGRERVEPQQQPERTRPVLRALEREPRPRARVSAEQAAAGREEELLPLIPVRTGGGSEEEPRRDQVHVVPAAGERRRKAVVVRRRVAQRVDEGDAHGSRTSAKQNSERKRVIATPSVKSPTLGSGRSPSASASASS